MNILTDVHRNGGIQFNVLNVIVKLKMTPAQFTRVNVTTLSRWFIIKLSNHPSGSGSLSLTYFSEWFFVHFMVSTVRLTTYQQLSQRIKIRECLAGVVRGSPSDCSNLRPPMYQDVSRNLSSGSSNCGLKDGECMCFIAFSGEYSAQSEMQLQWLVDNQ